MSINNYKIGDNVCCSKTGYFYLGGGGCKNTKWAVLKGTLCKISIFYGEANGTTKNQISYFTCDLTPYSCRNKHFPDIPALKIEYSYGRVYNSVHASIIATGR